MTKPTTITITKKCVFTGKEYSVVVPIEGYSKWKKGMLIQDALPELSVDDREFLISGISPEGWSEAFGEED